MTMLLLLLALQAAQPPSPTVTPVTAALADYNIGVADIIDVVVFGEPDASRTGEIARDTGNRSPFRRTRSVSKCSMACPERRRRRISSISAWRWCLVARGLGLPRWRQQCISSKS